MNFLKGLILKSFSVLGFAIPLIYEIFLLFDYFIYSAASYCMQAFFHIAQFNLTSETYSIFSYIMGRVMILSGVFALFRLSISLINYMINPSALSKVEKDGANVVKNIVIAVILLVSIKFIFEELYKFQTMIIEQNVIQKIIYGPEYNDNQDIETKSKMFTNNVFLQLFVSDSEGTTRSKEAQEAYNSVAQGGSIMTLSPYAYDEGFHYIPFVTGIVGILLAAYFVRFAIELAVRMLKLFVLQVLSPIPIILSVDPTQKNKIANFFKVYIGIYLSVFVRILTIYLAFVILNIFLSQFSNNSWILNIVLLIAVFQGAKELPKLVEDALGMKLGLGDANKGFAAVLGGAIGGMIGTAGGAIAGGVSGGLGGALAGAAKGGFSGITKGAAAKSAVASIGAGFGGVTAGYGGGKQVAAAGGLGALMMGGWNNLVGHVGLGDKSKLDNRTQSAQNNIKAAESDIERLNKAKEKVSNVLSDRKGHLDNLKQLDTLRNGIGDSFNNTTFGMGGKQEFIRERLNNNNDYKAAMDLLQNNASTADPADVANLEAIRNKAISNASNEYDTLRKEYIDRNYEAYNRGDLSAMDEEFRSALESYNDFCSTTGNTDRMISAPGTNTISDTSGNTYFEGSEDYARIINEQDIDMTENNIKKYEQEVKDKEKEIKNRENEKASYNKELEDIKNSKEQKRMDAWNNKGSK